jgi:HSP20 family protein
MERLMDETFGRPMMWRRLPGEEYTWSPAMEMYEKGDSYVIRLELPGVKSDEVDISMSGETLTVKGERKPSEDIREEEYQLCEVCYGSFTRAVTLPESVDPDRIEAIFNNGLLEIRLPKAEEIKPRQIKIQNRQSESQAKPKGGESMYCENISEEEKNARGDANLNP